MCYFTTQYESDELEVRGQSFGRDHMTTKNDRDQLS